MSLFKVFDISGSGMRAQSLRLTTTASNLSNGNVVSNSPATTYRPRYPIFSPVNTDLENGPFSETPGVKVDGISVSNRPVDRRYQPEHPLADSEGYVYVPNVNMVEEMTNMISASRSYQMNVEVVSTVKDLMSRTLQMGT